MKKKKHKLLLFNITDKFNRVKQVRTIYKGTDFHNDIFSHLWLTMFFTHCASQHFELLQHLFRMNPSTSVSSHIMNKHH